MQFLILEMKFWFPEMVHMKHTLQDKMVSKFCDLFKFGDQAPILYLFPTTIAKQFRKLWQMFGVAGVASAGEQVRLWPPESPMGENSNQSLLVTHPVVSFSSCLKWTEILKIQTIPPTPPSCQQLTLSTMD